MLPARRLADDGLRVWTQVLELGYEGLVGKDEASPYAQGRTLSWLKVKVPSTARAIVAGIQSARERNRYAHMSTRRRRGKLAEYLK